MFRHPLIIVLVLIVKETNADFWCPKNILECLVNCLFQCDQIVTDEIEQIRCRIECAKENYCIRKPWDLLNKKMALARRYTKCMIGCADHLKDVIQHPLDLFLCDVGCRKDFDEKLPELIIKPLD